MSKLETNTIDTVSGTSTLQVGSTNTSTITLGVSGDTINVPSGVTIANSGTATGFGGTNTPNFWVYLNSNQSVATTTFTTVAFANELFDSANAFDTSTHKYTAPSAGKWFFGVQVRKENSRTDRNLVHFKVNNSTKSDFETGSYSNYGASIGTTIIDLNANDVVHLEFYHDRGSNQSIRGGVDSTFFYGYKLIE